VQTFINKTGEIEYVVESYTRIDVLNELNEIIENINDQLIDETESITPLKIEHITDDVISKFIGFMGHVYQDSLTDDAWGEIAIEFESFVRTVHPICILEDS